MPVQRSLASSTIRADLTVIGAGPAGIGAAVSAARLGRSVALVTDRSVLGGNAGKEVRLDANGAEWFGPYRRETGLIEEIKLENLYRNPQANIELWDLVLLETVRREKNIRLFFDTAAFAVSHRERLVRSVTGFQVTTARKLQFRSSYFVDATGDGTIAWLAGASFLRGHESARQFAEPSASKRRDSSTMGSTLLMSFRKSDRPIKFHPPEFAYPIPVIERMIRRSRLRLKDVQSYDRWGVAFWWAEHGGLLDTIKDAESIRFELERIVWGIYNYMKNGGVIADAERIDLAWMQSCPGKRESRRFLGDHVLSENDILASTSLPDAVAYGGWPMDNHPSEGFWGTQSAVSRPVVPYDIPLRSLYARDLDNLFLAGRDISATHLAMSSTRVMATCMQMGQAVGTAAHLCKSRRCAPRSLVGNPANLTTLQDLLIRNDATILNKAYDLRWNLGSTACISASSTFDLQNTKSQGIQPLDSDAYFLCRVTPAMKRILFKADVGRSTSCRIDILEVAAPLAYDPGATIDVQRVPVARMRAGWISVSLAKVDHERLVFIRLRRNLQITLHTNSNLFTLFCTMARKDGRFDNVVHTKYTQAEANLCFKVEPPVSLHTASQTVNGYIRPFAGPNSWISALGDRVPRLEFSWSTPQEIRRIDLFLNSDLNGRINTSSRNPVPVRSTLIRDYDLQTLVNGRWKTIHRVQDNHQRWTRCSLDRPVRTRRVRAVFRRTWGTDYCEVFEMLVYGRTAGQ